MGNRKTDLVVFAVHVVERHLDYNGWQRARACAGFERT